MTVKINQVGAQKMDYMARALSLARLALGNTSPNPAVGAVVVKKGVVVGQGFTQPPGSDHAEIMALRQAGDAARGATLYVTLEPCCHYGRTPPCTGAIINAGIAEVHYATNDPNPVVNCQGKEQLEKSGVKVYTGEHEEESRRLNEAYIKYIVTRKPFIIAKFAMSLDGKIATATGDSRWISGEESRRFVHYLRHTSDAIMVGVNTVLTDNPQLTVRIALAGGLIGKQPYRVILDSRGRTPPDATVFKAPGKTLMAVSEKLEPPKLDSLRKTGAELIKLPEDNGLLDLERLFEELGKREITSVLVEGGGILLGSLFDRRLVDKVYAFIAPIIIGGQDAKSPVESKGVTKVGEAWHLQRTRVEMLGEDIMVAGYLS